MAKCLVLGGNGFIASHLVDALVAGGHQVRAFDRFGGVPVYDAQDKVEQVSGDFMNLDDLKNALQGMEYVFHFISTTTPASAENDPLIDVETNIRMSIELFQACVDAKVKRVIFASTGGAIYGQDDKNPHAETDNPQPVSPYAIGKLTIEHYLRYFKVKKGLDSVVLRISNPYGERQPLHRRQGVIPIFLETMLSDEPITVQGDGTMVRDYIYVKDVAKMVTAMFDKPSKYGLYNVGSGKGYTVNELVQAIEKVSGKTAKITHVDVPSTFVNKVVLDTSRFSEEFGISAQTDLEEGLVATCEYLKEGLAHGA